MSSMALIELQGVRGAPAPRGRAVGSNYPRWPARPLLFFKCPLAGPQISPPSGSTLSFWAHQLPPCHDGPANAVPMRCDGAWRHHHAHMPAPPSIRADNMPCGKCMTLVSRCGMIREHLPLHNSLHCNHDS